MQTDTNPTLNAPNPGPTAPPNPRQPSRWRRYRWPAAALLATVLIIPLLRTLATRAKANQAPSPDSTTPVVPVVKVTREDLFNRVTIPAEFRPYLQVDLHAKVSGYVQEISVDIGDRVKAGQLLATLEVPELRDELDQAKASQQRAEADYTDAHLAWTRLTAVNHEHSNLVAQQDLDNAEAKDRATAAALAAAKADVEKYQTLFSYTRITAPFAGVVTRRYADPGSLIQAGTASDTQSMPLVQLSDNYRLRLDFPVSVAYVKDVRNADTVEVKVESLGGKAFDGAISRSAQKVDLDTRTMITEVEVPNPNLELVPGMYATVALRVGRRPGALAIPTEAVSADKQGIVDIVNQSQQIEERRLTLGLETPNKYEVLSGLNEGDLVLLGNRSQYRPGQKVAPKIIGALAQD